MTPVLDMLFVFATGVAVALVAESWLLYQIEKGEMEW